MIGTSNFPQHVNKIVQSYKTGDSLHGTEYIRPPAEVHGGLILNLPLVDVKEYLERKLAMANLLADDYLITYLEQRLLNASAAAKVNPEPGQQ